MFGETFRYGTTGTVLALGCGVVAAGGLILLTTERIAHTHAEETAEPVPSEPVATGELAGELLARLPEQRVAALRESVLVPMRVAASAPEEVLVPAPVAPEGLLVMVPEGVLIPSPGGVLIPSPAASEGGQEHREPSEHDDPPNLYGPFYGGPYVPMPVLDRHRTRVKS
jgi:hypothetical protein